MRGNRGISGVFLLCAILLTLLIAAPYFIGAATVQGDSMLPALHDQDRILIDRLSYRTGSPKRFDLVVFSYHYRPNTYYIKRVIALPGETVRISDQGVIYINGTALVEHYGNAPIQNSGLASCEVTLGSDEYFVLGDNRNASVDSREPDVGNIKESDIVGKGWLCIAPFARFGVLK